MNRDIDLPEDGYDCNPDTHVVFSGGFTIQRQPASGGVIDAEITEMTLTAGDGTVLVAGAGLGAGGGLMPTLGTTTDNGDGTGYSSFDVFFEIDVLGSGRSIRNGDVTPGTGDGTDFGAISPGGGQKARDFTIRNDGTATLELTGTPLVQITGPGVGDFTVTVQPADDSLHNGANTTFRSVFAPQNAGVRTATVTIASTDADESPYTFTIRGTGLAPSVSVADTAVTEGDAGTADAVFTLTISADPFAAVDVAYVTGDGTAKAADDYQAAAGIVTFLPGGSRTQTVSVSVFGDTDPEPDETFFLNLTGATNAGIGRAKATATVRKPDGRVSPRDPKGRAVFNDRDGEPVTVRLAGPGDASASTSSRRSTAW